MESATHVPQGQLLDGGSRAQASGRHETSPLSSNWDRKNRLQVIPWGPRAFKKFKDLLIFIRSLRLELSRVLPLSLGFTSTLGSRNHQLLCVTEGGPETQGREDSLKVTKTIRGRAGVQTETSFKCSQMHRY